ncbi:hypothetical protein HPB52_014832 [Rhipicephalus sanguineus]|uniref:Uncharacterized protein n=1 Tax=Rhipicephalus sanguineus TaxID=34632 RepID=A0A9D4PXP9_RHISA|nr:hypothetical protein HPB52_014832 [Rhipicephalus sanguineus]
MGRRIANVVADGQGAHDGWLAGTSQAAAGDEVMMAGWPEASRPSEFILAASSSGALFETSRTMDRSSTFGPLGGLGKLGTEPKHCTNTAGKFETFGDVDVTHNLPTVRLLKDCLSVRLFDQYEPCVAKNLLRKHLGIADRMTELLWQVQLRQLRVQVNKNCRKVVCDVHVPEGFELPGSVREVLGLGPKFAQTAKRTKPELLSIVREVSKRAPELDAARMNSEGLDALPFHGGA